MSTSDEKSNALKPDEIPRTVPGFLHYLFKQIIRKRKWLLIPLWILLAIIAALLMISGSSYLLPGIYIAF